MMTSRANVFNLSEHKMFEDIKKGLPEGITRTQNIMDCKDEVLYVWNSAENCVLTLNIKTCEIEENVEYQRLLLTETPTFAVERLLLNPLSTLACVTGPAGACALRLPRKSGPLALFQGGRPTVLCKSQVLDDRLFRTQCEIYQVAWHPGSNTDSHLLILASDNTFRLYDLSASTVRCVRVIPLGRRSAPAPALRLGPALGEASVGFTLSPPRAPRTPKSGPSVLWPALVLRGNGDVCTIDVSIDCDRSSPPHLMGPLPMYPPADDNYGVESCSIIMLGNHLVCVATCGGTLYHCVLLPDEQDNDKITSNNQTSSLPQNQSLYVIEAIELDLGLSLSDSDPSYSCPIFLTPDEGVKNRYFCSHETGIHVITVPIVNQLEAFFNGNDDDIDMLLPTLNQPSSAEYAVCTKTCKTSSANPPLGLTVSYSPHAVWTLLATGDVVWRPLSSGEAHLLMDTHYSVRENNRGELSTSLKELQKVPFDVHISQILKHELSQPILKTATQSEPQAQQCFELLTHATHIFHEEFFTKLERARKELDRRVKTLRLLKKHQLSEAREAGEGRQLVDTERERIREKCQRVTEVQQDLNERCCRVLRALRQKQAAPSLAEKELSSELSQAEARTRQFKRELDKIKYKVKCQEDKIREWDSSKLKKEVLLGKHHTEIIKSSLEKQTEQIKEIIQHINVLKSELNIF